MRGQKPACGQRTRRLRRRQPAGVVAAVVSGVAGGGEPSGIRSLRYGGSAQCGHIERARLRRRAMAAAQPRLPPARGGGLPRSGVIDSAGVDFLLRDVGSGVPSVLRSRADPRGPVTRERLDRVSDVGGGVRRLGLGDPLRRRHGRRRRRPGAASGTQLRPASEGPENMALYSDFRGANLRLDGAKPDRDGPVCRTPAARRLLSGGNPDRHRRGGGRVDGARTGALGRQRARPARCLRRGRPAARGRGGGLPRRAGAPANRPVPRAPIPPVRRIRVRLSWIRRLRDASGVHASRPPAAVSPARVSPAPVHGVSGSGPPDRRRGEGGGDGDGHLRSPRPRVSASGCYKARMRG